jgi:hypothetical protein
MFSHTVSVVDEVCGISIGLAISPTAKPTTSMTTTRPIVIIFAILFFLPSPPISMLYVFKLKQTSRNAVCIKNFSRKLRQKKENG